jgi:transcriptional regulator with XRE-family HTH domain
MEGLNAFRLSQTVYMETTLITPAQSRAARGLVDWSQTELAAQSNLSESTIRDFEKGRRVPSANNLAAVRRALESAGVIFVAENGDGPGVRLRKQRENRANLNSHIEHLEGEVAGLKGQASAKPSPDTGMAMLRRGRAKSELAKAKNKRAKGSPK